MRDFLVQAGSNKITLTTGRYNYKYTACGIQFSGKIDLRTTRILRIARCATTKLIIKNYTIKESPGSALTLRLTGPINYYFVLTKPIEKLTVQQGTYHLQVRGCGQLIADEIVKLELAQYRWNIHCPEESQ